MKSILAKSTGALLTALAIAALVILPADAATKLSQIANGGAIATSTDQLVGVRSGTTDVLVTMPPIAPTVFACTGADQTSAINTLLSTDGNYLFTGTCLTTSIVLTSKNLTLDFAQGAVLEPASKIDILWRCNSCTLNLKNFNVNGLGLAQTAFYISGGDLVADNVNIINMGYPVDSATNIVTGFEIRDFLAGHIIKINKFVESGFNSIGNGSCGDALGSMRGIYMQDDAVYADIYHFEASGGTDTEDNDFFQAQLNTVGGVIHEFVARYNNNTRRMFKRQSGNWTILNVDAVEGADFVPVSGSTQIGKYNLNGFDNAGGIPGSLTIVSGYIDCSGFDTCVTNSGGVASVRTGPGLTLFGPTLTATRSSTACNPSLSGANTFGLFSGTTGVADGLNGTTVYNFGIGALLQGKQDYSMNARFYDPVFEAAEISSSTAKDGIIFRGNDIITQTAGNLNNTQIVKILNATNVKIENNRLLEDGNTTHAATLFGVTNSGASGYSFGNIAPSGTTVVSVGGSALINHVNNDTPGTADMAPALVGAVITPAISTATFATDASLGNTVRIALSHAACPCTLSNPTNPTDGQVITYEIIQSSSGSDTIGTYGTAFTFGTAGQPTLTTTANKRDLVGFKYSGSSSKWNYLGSELGF